jgi:hypothetical protein
LEEGQPSFFDTNSSRLTVNGARSIVQ